MPIPEVLDEQMRLQLILPLLPMQHALCYRLVHHLLQKPRANWFRASKVDGQVAILQH